MPGIAPAQQFLALRVDDLPAGPQRGVVVHRLRLLTGAVATRLVREAHPQRGQRRLAQLTGGGDLIETGEARPHRGAARLPAQPRLVGRVGPHAEHPGNQPERQSLESRVTTTAAGCEPVSL
jgi:hypothetical protein